MKISSNDAGQILFSFFKNIPGGNLNTVPKFKRKTYLLDDNYSFVPKSVISNVFNSQPWLFLENPIVKGQQISDCDDFSLQLKASVTAIFRQKSIQQQTVLAPPAIGIVVSRSHVVNVFITRSSNNTIVNLLDPLEPNRPVISDPNQAPSFLKQLPIKFIYM